MDVKKIFSNIKKYRGNENDINIEELNEMIKRNSTLILLDVRSPQEYKEGALNRSNKYTVI